MNALIVILVIVILVFLVELVNAKEYINFLKKENESLNERINYVLNWWEPDVKTTSAGWHPR